MGFIQFSDQWHSRFSLIFQQLVPEYHLSLEIKKPSSSVTSKNEYLLITYMWIADRVISSQIFQLLFDRLQWQYGRYCTCEYDSIISCPRRSKDYTMSWDAIIIKVIGSFIHVVTFCLTTPQLEISVHK